MCFIDALFQEKGVRGWVSFAQRFENAVRKGKRIQYLRRKTGASLGRLALKMARFAPQVLLFFEAFALNF
jgi:hypothetical protein